MSYNISTVKSVAYSRSSIVSSIDLFIPIFFLPPDRPTPIVIINSQPVFGTLYIDEGPTLSDFIFFIKLVCWENSALASIATLI
jgi:hypothetical protein